MHKAMKRNEKLLLNTIIIAIGTFTTKVLSFIMVPFYTAWLSPEEYGDFDLLVTYISFFISFVTLQLEQAIFRFCMENRKDSNKILAKAIQIVVFNVIIYNILMTFLLKNKSYCIPFLVYFDFYAIYLCLSEYLRGNDKLKMYSLCNILVAIGIVLLNIIFVCILKLQTKGMLLAYGISYFIGTIIIIIKEKIWIKFLDFDKDKKVQKEMLRYSVPLIPNAVSWWITHITDRTIIKIVLGSFYNGIYAVSCKIPTIVNILFSVFNLSWQQTAISALNDKDKNDFYNNIYIKLIKFLYTISLVIIAITPFIFKFFISPQYLEGIYQIPIILNGIVFLCFAQFLNAIFLANKDTKSIGITTTIAAVINLMINLVLIKFIGLTAASISTLVSYFILYILRYKKLSYVFLNKKIIKMIMLYNFIYILVSSIIFIKFNYFLNSIIAIVTIVVFIIKNKSMIKLIIKRLDKGVNR